MNSEVVYFLICMLIPRLFLQWKDQSENLIRENLVSFLCELFLLSPLFSVDSILYILVYLLYFHLLVTALEFNGGHIFLKRVLQFIFLLITAGFLFGTVLGKVHFNTFAARSLSGFFRANVFTAGYGRNALDMVLVYLFGMLVAVNEINNLIRFILGLIHLTPAHSGDCPSGAGEKKPGENDAVELRRGKIIGAVERLLFFFFVMTGNYTSIGFILTAKGITRFKELDDKNFAEYVLIGTLLSAALSIFWAFLIKVML